METLPTEPLHMLLQLLLYPTALSPSLYIYIYTRMHHQNIPSSSSIARLCTFLSPFLSFCRRQHTIPYCPHWHLYWQTMYTSKPKAAMATTVETCAGSPPPAVAAVAKINGRPVLQPNCNRCTTGPTPASLPTTKKVSLSIPTSNHTNSSPLPLPHPISFPTSNRSPRPPLNSCPIDDDPTLRSSSRGTTPTLLNRKKSKSFNGRSNVLVESYSSSLILESPGSIAAVRREQMALQHAQRKMRIAHYGRCKSAKFDARVVPLDSPPPTAMAIMEEDRRCSFITSNSGLLCRVCVFMYIFLLMTFLVLNRVEFIPFSFHTFLQILGISLITMKNGECQYMMTGPSLALSFSVCTCACYNPDPDESRMML